MSNRITHINQKRKRPMFSVTINENILEAFAYCADKHSINKSNFVEKALIKWIQENEPDVYKKISSELSKLDFIKDR